MKLKTLKEIHYEWDGTGIESHKIREEAIKWYHRSDGNKHKFIKEFFNITDDELKQRLEV